MLAAFAALFVALLLAAMRAEIFRRRVRAAELVAAQPHRRRAAGIAGFAMTHLGYIVAAYLAAAIVLVGMVAWRAARSQRAEAQARAA